MGTENAPGCRGTLSRKYVLCLVGALVAAGVAEAPRAGAAVSLPGALPQRSTVLVLIQESEMDPARRVVLDRLIRWPLARMGFRVRTHALEQGLPGKNALADVHGIVTFFRRSHMPRARDFVAWFHRHLSRGIKGVVLGNFGAYQDQDSGEWLPHREINRVFHALGIHYAARWTDRPELLRVRTRVSAVVEYQRPLDLRETRHYYLFRLLAPERSAVFLSLVRTDLKDSESAVVVATPWGGMALSNYLYSRDSRSGEIRLRLNPHRFLAAALFGPEGNSPRVLVVADGREPRSRQVAQNAVWTLKNARIPVTLADYRLGYVLRLPHLRRFRVAVLGFEELWKLKDAQARDLEQYVREGGSLVVLYRGEHPALRRVLGIRKAQGFHPTEATGLTFLEPLAPGMEGPWLDARSFTDVPLKVNLLPQARVLARYHDGTPALWEHTYGRGRVLFWNTSLLGERRFRGMLLQSLLRVQEAAVVWLLNAKLLYLDDFPLPTTDAQRAPVDRTDTAFYRDVWWPAMEDLARRFRLRYTAGLVFTYTSGRESVWDGDAFFRGSGLFSVTVARHLLAKGHELALHGYNHQPLLLDPGSPHGFTELSAMEASLRAARRLWIRLFGEHRLPVTYIPPMNRIGPRGKALLVRVFPEIRAIASLAVAPSRDPAGRRETAQEPGPDPDLPQAMDLPRHTSGYIPDQDTWNDVTNAVWGMGYWAHFIHADDVYDPERSLGRSWQALYQGLETLLARVQRHFPWLRPMTAREAAWQMRRLANLRPEIQVQGKRIRLELGGWKGGRAFFLLRLRTGRPVCRTGCTVVHGYSRFGLWILEATAPVAEIQGASGTRTPPDRGPHAGSRNDAPEARS